MNVSTSSGSLVGGTNYNNNNNNNLDARFSCNICFDAVVEPVVTQCGHLYCWPCLYKWLEAGMHPADRIRLGLNPLVGTQQQQSDTSRRVCPVCKAACTITTIVPIYVRSSEPTPVSTPTVTSSTAVTPVRSNSHTNKQQNQQHELDEHDVIPNIGNNDDNDNDDIIQPRLDEYVMNNTNENYNDLGYGMEDDDDVDNLTPSSSSRSATAQSVHVETVRETEQEDNTIFATGIRQRRTGTTDATPDVPRRPVPPSPARPPASSSSSSSDAATSPIRPTTNSSTPVATTTVTSSGGILSPFVQDTMMMIPMNNRNRSDSVPLIHRPEGFNSTTFSGNSYYSPDITEADPGATEYLSRILLMLGSFVILCLLLF